MSIIYTLYLKIHNVTKLKHLGFTKKPHTYRGSGKFWKAHIKKYVYDSLFDETPKHILAAVKKAMGDIA